MGSRIRTVKGQLNWTGFQIASGSFWSLGSALPMCELAQTASHQFRAHAPQVDATFCLDLQRANPRKIFIPRERVCSRPVGQVVSSLPETGRCRSAVGPCHAAQESTVIVSSIGNNFLPPGNSVHILKGPLTEKLLVASQLGRTGTCKCIKHRLSESLQLCRHRD